MLRPRAGCADAYQSWRFRPPKISSRLIDWEKLTQVQCAEQMGIARTTVTGIYDSARTKLADALIHGKMLMIQGGDYTLCSGDKENCSRRCCKKEKEKER